MFSAIQANRKWNRKVSFGGERSNRPNFAALSFEEEEEEEFEEFRELNVRENKSLLSR